MRIIAFSDIHGSYQKVEDVLSRESGYDVVIIAGDLTTYGSPEEAESALRDIQSHGKPVVAVAGNMDPPRLEETFSSTGVTVNARGRQIGNVGFFGVSGSPLTPMHTPYELSEEEIERRAETGLSHLSGTRWKVFIPHAPPHKTKLDRVFFGTHVGSTSVRSFVERHQPHLVVCGHIHEARGIDTLGSSQLVNCGPAGRGYYVLIDIAESITIRLMG